MTPEPPARKGRPPPVEPVLPRLLVLEIGAGPERRRRAVGLPLVLVALVLAVLVGLGVLGAVGVHLATRPTIPGPPLPSGKVAPGTPDLPVPASVPEPVPDPDPEPEPVPEPEPEPITEPSPVPDPKPKPRPKPVRTADPFAKPEVAPGTPGRLVVEGEVVVELRGELGGFRVGTPLPPGPYAVWADFGAGLVDTGVATTSLPGRAVTVMCVVEHRMCAIMP